jgi:glutamyl-tRNA(Gln) amidotransferase subunit E
VDHLRELFSLLKAGRFAKEAMPDLLREMARRGLRASEATAALGVRELGREELERIVDEILDASADLVKSRGAAAEKAVMGRVMEKVRGRADGKVVSETVRKRLEGRQGKRKASRGKKEEK